MTKAGCLIDKNNTIDIFKSQVFLHINIPNPVASTKAGDFVTAIEAKISFFARQICEFTSFTVALCIPF